MYNICDGNQDSGNPENPLTEANASLYVEPNFRKRDGVRKKDGVRKQGGVRERYLEVDEAQFHGSTSHRWEDEVWQMQRHRHRWLEEDTNLRDEVCKCMNLPKLSLVF